MSVTARVTTFGAGVLLAATLGFSGTAGAASAGAGCTGQFFSGHAGLVPASGGEESVGGFIHGTAKELGSDFGAAISGARFAPRDDCGL